MQTGKVYLIGAGPGDPGLITLRGVECLGRADLVLYDYLVDPGVLEHIPAASRSICLGRHGHSRIWSQEEILEAMASAATQGQTVARLKGGDPSVFGRSAEETAFLSARGIPWEMVPGVTAATAAAAYTGTPLTQRDAASAVALVTGRESPNKEGATLDYRALAAFPGTLVFYMGVTTADRWVPALLSAGKPPDTPAVIVRRTTLSDQETWSCRLDEVPQRLVGKRPPILVLVGSVAEDVPDKSWFSSRPLFGRRVLVTRPEHQAQTLRRPLAELGAQVDIHPVIEIEPAPDRRHIAEVLRGIESYDWLVFSSANGVRYFFEALEEGKGDLRRLGSLRLAAIGPGTARELRRRHLKADVVPDEYRAEALADSLQGEAAGARFLLARASRGREVLAQSLVAAGGSVEQVVVYASRDRETADPEVVSRLEAGGYDYVTVTSSAIARATVHLFGSALAKTRLVAISPLTAETLEGLGRPAARVAETYTMPGVVAAILDDAATLAKE